MSISLGGKACGEENPSTWPVAGEVGGRGAGEDVSPTLRRAVGGAASAGLAGELVALSPP